MAGFIKYRVHEVAKDFQMKSSKSIVDILSEYAEKPKNHMQVLGDEELNIIFSYLTEHNQINSIADIYADTAPQKEAPKAKDTKAPASGEAPKPAEAKSEPQQAATQTPAKVQQGAVPQ